MGMFCSSEEAVQEDESYIVENSESDLEYQEPWCLEPYELERWYNENIQNGTKDFDTDCRQAVDRVVKEVQRLCSSETLPFVVGKVVKGGSLGKGTMVKDLSDVDLVAFINPPYLEPIFATDIVTYQETLATIIADLEHYLGYLRDVTEIWSNGFLVHFKVNVGYRLVEVDLLPTTDNVRAHPGDTYLNMFYDMLDIGFTARQFYSASLVKHQVDFVKGQPAYVKSLIRMVKYWANQYLPDTLQKSYPLELITIHLWEKAGKPDQMSKAQGLKKVLQVLTSLRELCVSWNYLHDDDDLAGRCIRRLGMRRPIVLDPANPTNNVCFIYHQRGNMQEIAEAAWETLQTDLLRNVNVQPNWAPF